MGPQDKHFDWLREDLRAMEGRIQAAIESVHQGMDHLETRTRLLEQDLGKLQEKEEGRWRWLTPVSLGVVVMAQVAEWLGWVSPPSAP